MLFSLTPDLFFRPYRPDAKQSTGNQCTIELEWIPGHQGIHGNELADKEAKAAAINDAQASLGHLNIT